MELSSATGAACGRCGPGDPLGAGLCGHGLNAGRQRAAEARLVFGPRLSGPAWLSVRLVRSSRTRRFDVERFEALQLGIAIQSAAIADIPFQTLGSTVRAYVDQQQPSP
jgi:hypothetical protein